MNRRTFLHNSTALTLGAAALPYGFFKTHEKVGGMGIQLYTVRDDMARDAKGTLRQLAETGYAKVESAGYKEGSFYGMKPKAFRKYLKSLGLAMPSGHCSTGAANPKQRGTLLNDWEMAVADAAKAGQRYIVLGYLSEAERKKIDDYKRLAEVLNKSGELCRRYNITFGYHNHDFEFMELDGQIPYDVLLREVGEENMIMELDLYWITKAGKDPFAYFRKAPGRFPLWHVKDMDSSTEQFFTEVGNGVIDFPAIFREEKTAGLQHFFVEQDICRNHAPLESAAISYRYLTGMEY